MTLTPRGDPCPPLVLQCLSCDLVLRPDDFYSLALGNRVLMGPVSDTHGDLLDIFLLEPQADYKGPLVLLNGLVATLPREQFPFDWNQDPQAQWQWDRFDAKELDATGLSLVDALYELPSAQWTITRNAKKLQRSEMLLRLPLKQKPLEFAAAVDWLLEGR